MNFARHRRSALEPGKQQLDLWTLIGLSFLFFWKKCVKYKKELYLDLRLYDCFTSSMGSLL